MRRVQFHQVEIDSQFVDPGSNLRLVKTSHTGARGADGDSVLVTYNQYEHVLVLPDYEVQGVKSDASGHALEMCEDEEATAWGLYERMPRDDHGQRLARWVNDFPTRRAAEAARQKLLET